MSQTELPSRSQNFSRSKSKVKFDFSKVWTRVIPILKRVQVGDWGAKIARIYGWKKQDVAYYLKKLEKCGLIRRDKRSSSVAWKLTVKGQTFLESCEGVLFSSGIFRLEKCQFRYVIVREGLLPSDFKRVEMINWTALLGMEQGVKVRHTSRSWIVHVETLYGKSPGELINLAKNLADRVSKGLMVKYSCILADGELLRGYELALDDPVAQLLSRYFCVSLPGRARMDHSPGELEGEIDFAHKDFAIQYLLVPEKVGNLERQVSNIGADLEKINDALQRLPNLEKLEKITDSLQKLTVILSRLVDVEGNGSAEASKGSVDGGKSYVS